MRGNFDFTRAAVIHQDKYNYSNVEYVNSDTKVIIGCSAHGDFLQSPFNHINRGHGCYKCRKSSKTKRSNDEWIMFARNIHGDTYDYSEVTYMSPKEKVKIICSQHGPFYQSTNNHFYNRTKCPACGHNTSREADSWLSNFANTNIVREFVITIEGRKFKVDGYDPESNTIYEYFGVFWHGHPDYTDHMAVNPKNGIPFSELYDATLKRLDIFQRHHYAVIFVWG